MIEEYHTPSRADQSEGSEKRKEKKNEPNKRNTHKNQHVWGNAVFHRRPPDRAVIFCYMSRTWKKCNSVAPPPILKVLRMRSFSAIVCSILRVFRQTNFWILRHFATVKFPDFRQHRLFPTFEFLVRASQDTKAGRCRHLRCAPIPHRCLIQEQHNIVRPIFRVTDAGDDAGKQFLKLARPLSHRTQG